MDYKNYKGYKSLPFFQQSEIIYDFTVEHRWLHSGFSPVEPKCKPMIWPAGSTHSMEPAAPQPGVYPALRCGRTMEPARKSLESRIKLLGVSRGSFEELLNDYMDFLRQRSLKLWPKDSTESRAVRKLVYNDYNSYNNYKNYMENPETAANAMICLINQTNQLLDQKLRWTEDKFVKEGGFRENLFKKRITFRNRL